MPEYALWTLLQYVPRGGQTSQFITIETPRIKT